MTQEKPNEPSINEAFRDSIDEAQFNALARESEQAFIGHASKALQAARTEYHAAEWEGDSRQANKSARSLSQLALGVALAHETIANIDRVDIPVTDMSAPAETIQVQHEMQHISSAQAA